MDFRGLLATALLTRGPRPAVTTCCSSEPHQTLTYDHLLTQVLIILHYIALCFSLLASSHAEGSTLSGLTHLQRFMHKLRSSATTAYWRMDAPRMPIPHYGFSCATVRVRLLDLHVSVDRSKQHHVWAPGVFHGPDLRARLI